MTLILSSHPISKDYLQAVREKIGEEITTINLSEIKRNSLFAIFKLFFGLRNERLIIVLEDQSMTLTLPAMEILAFCSRCSQLAIFDHNLSEQELSRLKIIGQIAKYPIHALLGCIDLFYFWLSVTILGFLKRDETLTYETNEVFYLKSNLWFGIKAGGSVGHVAGVINSFIERGWKSYFFSIEKPQMTDQNLNFVNVPFTRPYIYPPDINNISYHRILLKKVRKFGACLNFKGIIYQRMSVFNFSGVVVSRVLKKPLFLEYNGSEVWISKNWGKPPAWARLAEKAEEVCLMHAHRIITVSEVLRDELIERGIEEERIIVYPNCIDPDVYDNARFSESELRQNRLKFNLNENDFIATFVGTFGMWHGVDILAEAIKKMADQDPKYLMDNRIKFLLVGDGFMMPKVQELIGGEKYKEFVRFAGLIPQNEGPIVLSASDVLLSPHRQNTDGSRFFGSPTKLFEYMGVQKPIIASDLEQISDIISPAVKSVKKKIFLKEENSKAVGILVAPGDVDELIESICWVQNNYKKVKFLGHNAREKILRKYTWNHHVAAIENCIYPYYEHKKFQKNTLDLKSTLNCEYILIGPLPPPLGGVSIYVQRYSKRLKKWFTLKNLDLKKMGYLRSVLLLLKMNFNRKGKIIHLNSGNLAALGILFFRVFPSYLRVQDHSERKLENYNSYQKFLLNLFLKRVDEMILVGEHLRHYYADHGIKLPSKVRVKLTFLPPDAKEEPKIWDDYADDLKSFITIRSPLLVINAYKIIYYNGIDLYGLDMALELISRLKGDYPNIGLLIALADPSDQKYIDQLKLKIEQLELRDHIYFMINQKILWPIFKKSDVMIRPTASDGFGISVAEALYLGCEAVASDVCARPKGTITFSSRDQLDLENKVRETLVKKTRRAL